MNGLEEIQRYIKKCIHEKEEVQQTIRDIEEKRTQLAGQRNEKKATNSNDIEVNQLGIEISKLGNQSQELQNKLDSSLHAIKSQVNLMIDNLVVEGIRKIRIINQEIQELEERNSNQKDRSERYELQKQEFYLRFGRMPELSDRAKKENELQEKETVKSVLEISQKKEQIAEIEEEITVYARIKREVKNGNWYSLIDTENTEDEELYIEEIKIEEMEPIEEIYVENFQEIEELYVEEFAPIEEITVEEFSPIEEITVEEFKPLEAIHFGNVEPIVELDEIEELARAIVEEIATEQTRDYNINKIEETVEDIIIFEQEENVPKSKVIIPLFGKKATISTIVVKFDEGELVYKAQMSDDEIIKVYPSKLGQRSVLLRDKQNREECKDILINYAISEYRVLDKKVISKIDPLICELLIECAEKYNYNAQELIYNYAMSFSNNEQFDAGKVPNIIYNLSYIEESNLSQKEKYLIKKICRNARKNNKVDIIESFSGFKKIKYILRRLFAVNNVKVLPEGKYE